MGEKKVSTSTGNKKFQRHKNKTAFVPNKFSQIALKIANTPIAGVCAKCKEILQWKQRMGKYKPLTQPKTCLICHKKSIVQAYHVICQPCQKVKRVCAKCHESTEIESETPKTNAEQMKSDQEFELKIASLSERQKRSYLRKIDRGDEEAAEKILMKAELNAKNNDPFGSWGEGSDDDLDDFDDDDEDDLDA